MTEQTSKLKPSRDLDFEDKYVTLPTGIRARYVEYGPPDAQALVLTHGFLRSLQDWRLNIKPLSENSSKPRRIIAFDWPGFGFSTKGYKDYSLYFYAGFMHDFITALGLESFDMMGHSMGGKYGLAFMIRHPQYVRKLVLVDTDAFIKDPWWTPHTTRLWFQSLGAVQFRMLGNHRFLKIFANQIFADKTFVPDEEIMKQEARLLGDSEQLESLRAMNYNYPMLSMRKTGLIDKIPDIKNDTLIIWGRQDKIVDISCAYETNQALSNSELYIYENCGHLPFVEKAEHFNRMVLDFLDKE